MSGNKGEMKELQTAEGKILDETARQGSSAPKVNKSDPGEGYDPEIQKVLDGK